MNPVRNLMFILGDQLSPSAKSSVRLLLPNFNLGNVIRQFGSRAKLEKIFR